MRVKRTLGAVANGRSQVGSSAAITGGGTDSRLGAAAPEERDGGRTGGRSVERITHPITRNRGAPPIGDASDE
ncbi:hypothetical protein GCM10007904_08860 [Oharaeibacter diazotrophicus]|nr:hypothetical protein GCM10007904_08860 [Oharaeibacter diazotrophicus]